jgi:hypothetical protein
MRNKIGQTTTKRGGRYFPLTIWIEGKWGEDMRTHPEKYLSAKVCTFFFFFFDIPNFSKREMLRYVKEYISYMKRININLILYVTYFL